MEGPGDRWLIGRDQLDAAMGDALATREVVAPVAVRGGFQFLAVDDPGDIAWDHTTTTLPAAKVLYRPREDLHELRRGVDAWSAEEIVPAPRPRLLVGVHPCDLHGILVLDRTLLHAGAEDPRYRAARRDTVIVGLNCQQVGPSCFCASFGTGPFFHGWMGQGPPDGCDLLLTDLGGRYLAEPFTAAGRELLPAEGPEPAGDEHLEDARDREAGALDRFRKVLDTRHLPELLMDHLDHPVWARVADLRCLSCTNCTMVCPTCFCYDVSEELDIDLGGGVRFRRWDSCQDQHFARVHFGNYRGSRAARLRQFVCHKLSYWVQQHGCYGCVGCGRCMSWCPTHIDLAEIATEIRRDAAQR